MKKFLGILSGIGYVLCTYLLVSLFSSAFCLTEEAFVRFKNSDTMLVVPENVEISGNKRLSRKEILFVAGLDRKVSFFDVDKKKIMLNLTTCGWVKTASAEKFFPNSVKIHIEEFEPVIVVNSRKKSQDSNLEIFTMWFADSDGIVFKRAIPGEMTENMPVLFLNYSTAEEDRKRTERIKKAVFISKKWDVISSFCKLNMINYEVLSGYSVECSGKSGLKAVVRLNEDLDSEWTDMMNDVAKAVDSQLAKNQWIGEYEFDKIENSADGKKYEMFVGQIVKNIKGDR